MKKKILFISDVPDFKGGAENSLFDLMRNPNIEPLLAVPKEGEISKAAKELSIKYFVIDFGSVLNVRRPFKLSDILRTFSSAFKAAKSVKNITNENNISFAHSNGLKAHGVACLARIIGGKPVFTHLRAIPFTLREKFFWICLRIIARRMVLVSRPCWFGNNLPANARVIFNGINITNTIKSERVPHKPFILGFVGRIQFTKGVDTLIEWFDYAYKKGLDIKLSIRGEPAPDELDYDRKVRQMVKDLRLENVCFFEGKIKGLEKIYAGIDLNIVSSVVPDPLPRSIMEALSFGIPVIGYPAGGIPYMIEDKKTGFLVSDKENFFKVVNELINNTEFYKSISDNAFKSAQEKFSLKTLHEKITAEYEAAS